MAEGKRILKFVRVSRHGTLGITYHVFRTAEFITLIAVIGLTSSFVSDMVNANVTPPSLLIGILSLVVLTELYIIITSILFHDQKMTFKWAVGLDSLILAGLIVLAVEAGRPLSYLQCSDIGTSADVSTFESTLSSLANALSSASGSKAFSDFIASARHVCTEMKAIWGLIIANCIFFAFTVITGALLSYMDRKSRQKSVGNDY